jgi:hypothetical protein
MTRWHRPGRGVVADAAWVVVLALPVWLLFGRTTGFTSTRLPGCGCGDVVQQVWLLQWAKVGLAHHHLSFVTRLIDYPRGVDLADSASFPLLAVLATPLTALAGPVVALNVLFRLAIWLTAGSMYATTRRLRLGRPAALTAAVAFAFSPAVIHQADNHLFLVFLPLLPPMLALTYRCVTGSTEGWRRRAIWLGLLAAAQFAIDSELLVATGLVVGLSVTVTGVVGRWWCAGRRDRAASVATTLAVAALVAAPFVAYPAWMSLTGPQHVSGPTQVPTPVGIDPLATVFAAGRGVVGWHLPGLRPGSRTGQYDAAYLGVVALVVVAVLGWRLRRSPLVRAALVSAVVAWVLALGPWLRLPGGHRVPMPLRVAHAVPGLQDLVPDRVVVLTDLSVAVLLALAVQEWALRWQAGAPRLVAGASVGAAVLTLLPTAAVPTSLVAAGSAQGQPVMTGVVLAVPYPDFRDDQAMLWQADDDLRFTLLGGYANRPTAAGTVTKGPLLEAPRALARLLVAPGRGLSARQSHRASRELPGFLSRWDVRWVVTSAAHPAAPGVDGVLDRDLGRPRADGSMRFWPVRRTADPQEQDGSEPSGRPADVRANEDSGVTVS